MSEAQRRAYVLADNRLAEQAGWDRDLLALEVGELCDLGVDLAGLGFEAGEIDALLRDDAPDPREEETPEVPKDPISRPGDLWVLGAHRLLCGDATDREAVTRLLDGIEPHLMVTDPPYGVAYDPAWRNDRRQSTTKRTGKVLNDDRADWREAWGLFPGDVAYVWHGALHAHEVADSLIASGFDIRAQIAWAKERIVLSRGHYHWQHEPAWYCVRGKAIGDGPQLVAAAMFWLKTRAGWNATTVTGDQADTRVHAMSDAQLEFAVAEFQRKIAAMARSGA